MEEGLRLEKLTGLGEIDAEGLNGLTLAYIGDAVYEIILRTYMISHGSKRVEKLHKHVTALVNAGAQSRLIGLIEDKLTEEELAIYKRGRNSKTITSAKNQSIADYRRATGLEALMGYLYLKKDFERIADLLDEALPKLNSMLRESAQGNVRLEAEEGEAL